MEIDPSILILEEISTNFVLRKEIASLYFMNLSRERDYGCMILWLAQENELAVAYNSGSQVKSTWFTFVSGKMLEKDDRMFGLVEMAKMSVPFNQMMSVAIVSGDRSTRSLSVHGKLFEVSSDTINF